jgi:hypothetical protein
MNDCSYVDIIILPTGAFVNRGEAKNIGKFFMEGEGPGVGDEKE